MAKIGRYAYPEITFDEALAYVKVLQDKCGGEAKRDTFSEAIQKKGADSTLSLVPYLIGGWQGWGRDGNDHRFGKKHHFCSNA